MTISVGDVIDGRLEVRALLGRGGFGEVFLVYDRALKVLVAAKTIRSEFADDASANEAFKREAVRWVQLEKHPCILSALWADTLCGRVFVEMFYVEPDPQGRVTLGDHLSTCSGPIDSVQALKWTLEFCHGMEHAVRHGIKAHRDVKPANLLITQRKTLKVSDFGLASAAEIAFKSKVGVSNPVDSFGISRVHAANSDKAICGTPGYIAPEVVAGHGADIRSDIYSFGLVLWQMAAGSRFPPFHVPVRGDVDEYLQAVFERQLANKVPVVGRDVQGIIDRCIQPDPAKRYSSFEEMRAEIESVLRTRWGIVGGPPAPQDHARIGFWSNKGYALYQLGEYEQSITCFSRALEIDPSCADAWVLKANALMAARRIQDAIACFAQAVELSPQDSDAWAAYGDALARVGRRDEAIACYSRAFNGAAQTFDSWFAKGIRLRDDGKPEEALNCFFRAMTCDPSNAQGWMEKAALEARTGDAQEAVQSLRRFIAIAENISEWDSRLPEIRTLLRQLEKASD